ncbi:MAG: flippase-like domain-containing protein [Desulfobacterales bacterium]|nr:flippase-like domain-containing protein [Desulfobacterales bacterium]
MKKKWIFLLRLGLALFLITFLISSIGIEKIIETIFKVNPLYGCLTFFCIIILFIISAFNVWILLRALNKIEFKAFLKVYAYSWSASLITPGQLGDASLIIFLKRYGIPLRRTSIAYMIDKLITLLIFLFIASYGSLFIFPELKQLWKNVFAILFLGIVVTLILIKIFKNTSYILSSFRKKLYDIFSEILIYKNNWYVIVINVSMTIIRWLTVTLCYYTSFMAFGKHVQWPDIAIIPIMSSIIGYIPVSVAGIGTVELTAIYLFSSRGIQNSVVLSCYLFLRFLQYALAAFLIIFSGSMRPKN